MTPVPFHLHHFCFFFLTCSSLSLASTDVRARTKYEKANLGYKDKMQRAEAELARVREESERIKEQARHNELEAARAEGLHLALSKGPTGYAGVGILGSRAKPYDANDQKQRNIGYYATPEEAAVARARFAKDFEDGYERDAHARLGESHDARAAGRAATQRRGQRSVAKFGPHPPARARHLPG